MSSSLRLALLSATTLILFGGGSSLLVSLAYPRMRTGLLRLPPDARARRVIAWAALPWLAAAALLALCFVPSFWVVVGLAVDHCPLHEDGHVHLCLAHAPSHPVTTAEWLLLGAGAVAVGGVVLRVVRAQLVTWRAVSSLLRVAGRGSAGGGLVESAEPLSVTAGLLAPLVLVSTGLRSRLAPQHLAAVLAHERAHAGRRDPLRMLAVALLCAAHGPATRRLLVADAALACEEAADELAAREVGDRVVVAEAILAVERVLGRRGHQVGFALGMSGCAAEARVEALLGNPLPEASAPRSRRVLLAAIAGLALAAAFEIHHITETVLDLIAR